MEIQPGTFAIALEAISNVSKEVILDKKGTIVPQKTWQKLRVDFLNVIENLYLAKSITKEEKENLGKKVNSMNNAFNSDKLAALLKYFNYPMTVADYNALKSRNRLLHGDINIHYLQQSEFDELFALSLRLHKLCFAIPLLMAGYKGYILNNCKIYGYEKSCKAFIKIGVKTNWFLESAFASLTPLNLPSFLE